jgi:phosphopantetheinyl transferase (holo-ACP synthase)
VAVAAYGGRVGVDREEVAARSAAFLETWFTEPERTFAQADPLRQTLCWCAKEAVAKALGTGFTGVRPQEIEVLGWRGPTLRVRLSGQAAARLAALHLGPPEVTWTPLADSELEVVARLPPSRAAAVG